MCFIMLAETPPTSFVVSLDCREDLARTRNLPACSDVDLASRRSPCELKGPADTMALKAVAAVSGDLEVFSYCLWL